MQSALYILPCPKLFEPVSTPFKVILMAACTVTRFNVYAVAMTVAAQMILRPQTPQNWRKRVKVILLELGFGLGLVIRVRGLGRLR